mgnify:CR=1 FL=1
MNAADAPLILSIESSCDDSGAAVLRGLTVLSNVVYSQTVHEQYGGVVPELASRAHSQTVVPTIEAALAQAGVAFEDLDAVAATEGPGLLGSLLVGHGTAKSIAQSLEIPFIGVHHIQAHVLAHALTEAGIQDAPLQGFPFLALVVSGGHTQLMRVDGVGRYALLGETIDDAAGEAFDKTAKLLGLGYPGGILIDRLAADGDPARFDFPRGMIDSGDFDFSFSGLKTAVMNHVRKHPEVETADVAASFQAAVVDVLVTKALRAALPAALASVSIRNASDPLPSRRDSAMSRSCRRRSCGCVRRARTRWGREVLAVDTFDTVRQ